MGRTAGIEVIRWCGEEARAGPWRGRRDVAYLSPRAGGPTPSTGFVQCCLDRLAADGFSHVVTSALTPLDQAAFLGVGFQVEERLRVLVHDLRHLRPVPALGNVVLRRARSEDQAGVLSVDHLAFDPFWQLDEAGLLEAISATPHTRFRVASAQRHPVAGYLVVGRAGSRGFVQRLAVHPASQGVGIGGALVLDGLHWLRRWRVGAAYVNTQAGNSRAFRLYQALGFRADSGALSVLSAGLAR
ncbi:MAG: GNAT family N-acetyltransferase [Acidimicrobiales bacterium]